ncbi:hypothetical protein KDAU_21360 [Dictyobacter aurantiacus]|uniref:Uncharacterized protein n=1 Tax=Dictyobacter aurantiacus TaxID=1936993 RepID=A0A401ZD53_9CHLR|nr:hypothetical protein KDAU_21360 [Dictyobacter aurantiacus]
MVPRIEHETLIVAPPGAVTDEILIESVSGRVSCPKSPLPEAVEFVATVVALSVDPIPPVIVYVHVT